MTFQYCCRALMYLFYDIFFHWLAKKKMQNRKKNTRNDNDDTNLNSNQQQKTKVVNAYMKQDRIFIDLVKEGAVKASKDVEHIGIPCHWTRCETSVVCFETRF